MVKTNKLLTVTMITGILGVEPWEKKEDRDPHWFGDYYAITYQDAIDSGSPPSEAEEKGLEAEGNARDEYYRQWENALLATADAYFGFHEMQLVQVRKRFKRFEVKPLPGKTWDDAAKAVLTTINGVGYFGYDSLKDFKSSLPGTSKQATMCHLHWIKQYGDIYGEASPERMLEAKLK